MQSIPSTCQFALKEWAVITAAIAAGEQTILLRKGGIAEAGDQFRVAHQAFWFLPTGFHQDPSAIAPGAQDLWKNPMARQPAPGRFHVELFALVHDVFRVRRLQDLESIAPEHVLSSETVAQRFHYRDPGLFVIVLRAYRAPMTFEVVDNPYLAGCKSWVELPESLSTAGLTPVIDDDAFAARRQQIQRAAKAWSV